MTASLLVHGIGLLTVVAARRANQSDRSAAEARPLDAIDIDLTPALPPAPAARSNTMDAPPAMPLARSVPTPRSNQRTTIQPNRREPQLRVAVESPTAPNEIVTAPLAPAPAPRVLVSELFAPMDGLAPTDPLRSVARGSGATGANRRDLFGSRGGTADTASVARAPVDALLGAAQHTEAAGTMEHDRTLARRVGETLMPLLALPTVAQAVMRARPRALPNVTHAESAGEMALNDAAEFGHGDHGLPPISNGGQSTCPPPRVVVSEIEIEQDASERVVATRLLHSSGVTELDRAALATLEEAIAHAPRLDSGQSRRSRWRVEIANRPTANRNICTEGFTVLPSDAVNDVYLMMRVMRSRD